MGCNARHSKQTVEDGIHIVYAFEYADQIVRTSATGFTTDDVGKIALQQDDYTFWILQSISPLKWVKVGNINPSGTYFPADELNVGDLFWRTDLEALFIYNGAEWKRVSVARGRIVTVALDGTGDYTGIQLAIDAVAPLASEEIVYIVQVSPGAYEEDITLANYVTVKGFGWDTAINGHVIGSGLIYSDIGSCRISSINHPAVYINCPGGEVDCTGAFLQSEWDAYANPSEVHCTLKVEAGLNYCYRQTELYMTINDTENLSDSTHNSFIYTTGTEAINCECTATYMLFYSNNPAHKISLIENNSTNVNTVAFLDGDCSAYLDLSEAINPSNIIHALYSHNGCGEIRIISGCSMYVYTPEVNNVNVHINCCVDSVSPAHSIVESLYFWKDNIADENVYLGSSTSVNDFVHINNVSIVLDNTTVMPGRWMDDGYLGTFTYYVKNNEGSFKTSGTFNDIRYYPPTTANPTVPTPDDGDHYYNTVNHKEYIYNGAKNKWQATSMPKIAQYLTVGMSGDTDFQTIEEAIAEAYAQGASSTYWFEIQVYPGTYVENPLTISDGINLTTSVNLSAMTTYIVAADPNEDLLTCYGGYVGGFTFMGVTNPTKCCIRASTANTLTVFNSCAWLACSTGIIVSGGASVIQVAMSVVIANPAHAIGTLGIVDGVGSLLSISSAFFYVPQAIIPYMSVNPIELLIYSTNGAAFSISSCVISVASKTTSTSVFLIDNGAEATVNSTEFIGNNRCLHIGPSGSGSQFITTGSTYKLNTYNVYNESATGQLFGIWTTDERRIYSVSPGALQGTVQYRNDNLVRLLGNVTYTYGNTNSDLPLSDYFRDFGGTICCEDGYVTKGSGLTVNVAGGEGFIRRSDPYSDIFGCDWEATQINLDASSTNYIVYDAYDGITSSTSPFGNDQVLLATAFTDGSSIRFLHTSPYRITALTNDLNDYILDTRRVALKSGLTGSQGTTNLKITVGSGSYYYGLYPITFEGYTDAVFSYFYGSNGATEVSGRTQVDDVYYDSNGTLTAMTTDYYKADTVVLTSDGRISVIYGIAQYSTQVAAENASSANIPTFIQPSAFNIMQVVIKKNAGIQSVVDIRPQPAFGSGGSGGTGVTEHSSLSGLSSDDHIQYLLVSGTRSMSGSLNMGTNNITNVGTVDGVDISGHASRHSPGGGDSLSTGTPTGVLVAATASEGTAVSFARSDHQHGIASGTPSTIGTANDEGNSTSVSRLNHVHAHGNQDGGTTHSIATTSVAGFLSSTDKTRLDGLPNAMTTNLPQSVGTTNIAGTAISPSHEDHVHAHGDQTSGTLHAIATTSVNGFMSSTDKTKLDTYPSTPYATGQITATNTITTNSTIDVLLTNMTVVPGAGNYLVLFSSTWYGSTSSLTATFSIYINTTRIVESERRMRVITGGAYMITSIPFVVTGVAAGQAISIAWRVSTGTATCTNRNLILQQIP